MAILDERIAQRRRIARRYTWLLRGLDLVPPYEDPAVMHMYRAYPILVCQRDPVRDHLAPLGLATQAYYTPLLRLQRVYRHLGCGSGSFPVAEAIAERLVCLPIFPTMTEEQVQEVAAAVRGCVPSAP